VPTYEQLLAAQNYAHMSNVEAMATGLPPGFGAGFKVTWEAPNLVKVGPGAANVNGQQVVIDEETLIDDSMWLAVRVQGHYYIYLNLAGEFEVDISSPIQSTDNDFHNYHPITGARFIGRLYVDSDGDQVFAATGTKSVPEVIVGASTWTDDSDYLCDGTDDDVEVNAAISYLSGAFGGGIVRLSQGTFRLASPIGLLSNSILEGAGKSTVLQPLPDKDAISATGTDGNEIVGAGIRDLRIKRAAVLTADCEDLDLDYADQFFVHAVEFDADAVIASPDPHDHTVIRADDCDDLLVMACDLRMAGRGVAAHSCTGRVVSNTISMSAPADKQYLIGVGVYDSPRFVVADNTIANLISSRSSGATDVRAVHVFASKGSSIRNNTIENIRAIAQEGLSVFDALASETSAISNAGDWGGSSVEIAGNVIRDVHNWAAGGILRAEAVKVHSDTDDASVVNNHIEHADVGVKIDASSCDRTSLSGNFVINCGQLIDYGNCEDANEPMVLGETVPANINCSWARSAEQAYEGTYSYKMTVTSGGSGSRAAFVDGTGTSDLHGLLPGTEYTLEAWIYVPSPGGPAASEVHLILNNYRGGSWGKVEEEPTGTGAWEKVTVTMTADPAATAITAYIDIDSSAASNEYIYVDNVRLYPTKSQNAHDNLLKDEGTDTRF
jgi:hypothetical protein